MKEKQKNKWLVKTRKNIYEVMVPNGRSNVKRREFSIIKYRILEVGVKWMGRQ